MIIDVNKSKQGNAIRPSLIDRRVKSRRGASKHFCFQTSSFNGFSQPDTL